MGLHSVDGTIINGKDALIQRQSVGTAALSPSVDGNPKSVPQVLIGRQKDGFGTGNDQGIKVSQQGVDVRTATPDQLVMSSAFNMFKIVGVYTISVSHPGTAGVFANNTIAHGLGYAPAYAAYVGDDSITYSSLPFAADYNFTASAGVGVQFLRYYYVRVYADNIEAVVVSSGNTRAAYTVNFKIFAFKETAA